MVQNEGAHKVVEAEEAGQLSGEPLPELASNTLTYFDEAASKAEEDLRSTLVSPTANALASVNTLNAGKALQNLAEIDETRRRDLAEIARRPAIARLTIMNEAGGVETLFITSATPRDSYWRGAQVTSYRSPKGRLAAIPVGSDQVIKLPGGLASFEVLARAQLRPSRTAGVWDALNTVLEREGERPLTILSLRALLEGVGIDDSDLDELERMLAEDRQEANVVEGLRRTVIVRMGLREQPLLDQYQDEIFRLPLDSRLAILGPPGSGKTTTLIKRLGLKLDLSVLEDDSATVASTIAGLKGHADSWLMFTPTELLRQYVKEAFARERVAASDHHIQVWDQYRLSTARNRLGILRSSIGGGAILREQLENLAPSTVTNQIGWFEDFAGWQANAFWAELLAQAQVLAAQKNVKISGLGIALEKVVQDATGMSAAGNNNATRALLEFRQFQKQISALLGEIQQQLEITLRRSLVEQMKSDRGLLDGLLGFLRTLGDDSDAEDPDDLEGDEDEEEIPVIQGDRELAFEAYKRALRSYARGLVTKRRVGARSRNGRIIAWLGDRRPSDQLLEGIGEAVIVTAALRRFANPLRQYLARMPTRYRRFRRLRQGEGLWYVNTQFAPNELSPLEVDLVMLAMLRAARSVLEDRRTPAAIDEPSMSIVRTVRDLLRTQIVVDEATDFSPIQLACMSALTDPAASSFVACGDFNQRITTFGSRSRSDLNWAIDDLDVRQIVVTYRHSRQLNAFAHKLAMLSGDESQEALLPADVDNEGVDPVLGLDLSGSNLVDWLRDRIVEIEHRTTRLPSIAILVNSEEEVEPLAVELNAALSPLNIQCGACPRGQVRGQDEQVRVFDVQHIKGLEFEAVFFVGVDKLALVAPEVFEKYLYVGSTRAAMYLGLTASADRLPDVMTTLAPEFTVNWKY